MAGWRAAGWRAAGWRDGWSENAVRSFRAVRGFCSSQGWTVPGGSVPVCGSVHGLPED